ncbi:unnamed protein product, partial [marine sediment metagenome]
WELGGVCLQVGRGRFLILRRGQQANHRIMSIHGQGLYL